MRKGKSSDIPSAPIRKWMRRQKPRMTQERLAKELGYKHRETVAVNLLRPTVTNDFFGRLVQRYPEFAVLARRQHDVPTSQAMASTEPDAEAA